jgi:hypothetical protein
MWKHGEHLLHRHPKDEMKALGDLFGDGIYLGYFGWSPTT